MLNHAQWDNKVWRRRKKIKTREERRYVFKWALVIILVAFFIILFVNNIIPLFSNIEIKDTSYAPRDLERKYHELNRKVRGAQERQ